MAALLQAVGALDRPTAKGSAELCLYVRYRDSTQPLELPADGTVEDLYRQAAQALDVAPGALRLRFQGEDLVSAETPLADTGLSAEACLEADVGTWYFESDHPNVTITENGLVMVKEGSSSGQAGVFGTTALTGKHSWTIRYDTKSFCGFGVAEKASYDTHLHFNSRDNPKHSWVYYDGGGFWHANKVRTGIPSLGNGDVIEHHLDMGKGTLHFKVNGADVPADGSPAFTDLQGRTLHPFVEIQGKCTLTDTR
eukprot:TRINITY_DN47303_c0_g1_i1.p1 TRINITY_DN47303_c0_g1~~TRINITY_DN47303_c0_g1_i1.p1  ORF type:complete len:273 (+),score=75.47 TRINITY_DN47303_c0_g1_i1:63-821(+)